MKLNIKSLALSLGIIFATVTLFMCIWYLSTGYGQSIMDNLNSLFGKLPNIKYENSSIGKNFGAMAIFTIFAGVDGIIFGALFGVLYNILLPKKDKKKKNN